MDAEVLKVEAEEACCVCGVSGEELSSPEEHDAAAPPHEPPLRSVLLHLNNTKMVPNGRLCASCIQRALEAYNFSMMLGTAKGPPPLSEKIRALRKKLHELTQKIDVFIVVGGGAGPRGEGAYSEDDIIAVQRGALEAARRADRDAPARDRNLRGDTGYQCTVCPLTFQRVSEYRAHVSQHAVGARHSCWTCGAQFPAAAAVAEHAAAAHPPPDPLHCYLCDTTFQSAVEMRRHEPTCSARCATCGSPAPSRAAAAAHAATHGACATCGAPLRPAARAAHLLAHRQAAQLVCGYDACILRFTTRNALLAHIRKCHAAELSEPAPATVACRHCDRVFASAAAMKCHARVHRRADTQEGSEWSEADGKEEYLEMETLEEYDDQ